MNRAWVAICLAAFAHPCFCDLSVEEKSILLRLTESVKHQKAHVEPILHRKGNKTIELETYFAIDADLKVAPAVLGNIAHLGSWALPHINERPTGGKYLIQILEAAVEPKQPDLLRIGFSVEVPLFRHTGHRDFKMRTSEHDGIFTLSGETPPQDNGVIESAEAMLKLFPVPNDPEKAWLYLRGAARLRPWVLYEALPEKVMERETGNRIQLIIENYQAEERRVRQSKELASKH